MNSFPAYFPLEHISNSGPTETMFNSYAGARYLSDEDNVIKTMKTLMVMILYGTLSELT